MLQEVQMVMDAKVKSMNEDLVTKEKSLQVCVACIPCLYLHTKNLSHLVLLFNHDQETSQHCL